MELFQDLSKFTKIFKVITKANRNQICLVILHLIIKVFLSQLVNYNLNSSANEKHFFLCYLLQFRTVLVYRLFKSFFYHLIQIAK